MARELAIELRERDAGVRGRRHVAVAMDQQRVEPCRADDQIDRRGRPAPPEFRSAATKHRDLLVARRGLQRRRELGGIRRLDDLPEHNAIDGVAALPVSLTLSPSEAIGQAGRFDGMLTIWAGNLAAQAWRRQHLARIAEPTRVDRVAQLLHHVEVIVGEHARHVVLLVRADAVLAGDRAAGFDAVCEDLAGHFFRQRRLPRNPLVVADQRVEVAIAGVEDVADGQSRSLAERGDRPSTSGSFVRGTTPSCT